MNTSPQTASGCGAEGPQPSRAAWRTVALLGGMALAGSALLIAAASGTAREPTGVLRGSEAPQVMERRLGEAVDLLASVASKEPLTVLHWSASSQNFKDIDQCGVQYAGYLPSSQCKYDSPAWCPATASDAEWLQADMGKVITATSIVVQGHYFGGAWGAVKEYKLWYSADGVTWKAAEQAMAGATSQKCDGEGEQMLAVSIQARFFRVYPSKWTHFPSMRVGFYGFPTVPKQLSVLHWSASSQNSKLIDQCGVQHAGYLPAAACKYDSPAWCPATASAAEWLQADMGKVITATSIVVQGHYFGGAWGAVKEYKLWYSADGVTWKAAEHAMAGATSQKCDGEREQSLAAHFDARFFRVYPLKWTHFPSMRVGFFGFAAP